MPRSSAIWRASAAGSWPGSSSSGRLLMIVRTPARASVSISLRSRLPAALMPGASTTGAREVADMVRLRIRVANRFAARRHPVTLKESQPKKQPAGSGGEAARALDEIAGAHPEALEPAQRHDDLLQILIGDRGLRQELDVAAMHDAQLVAQGAPLVGEPDVDRAAVVHRALLHEVVVLDHLLDVVGNVRAQITAPQRQLADGHLGVADVEQHQALHVVDVVDAKPFELQLHDFEKMAVKPLDQRNHLEIPVRHHSLIWRPTVQTIVKQQFG